MVEKREIKVKTRKEFIELFKKEFIPRCTKLDAFIFDFGWAMNNWTCFGVTDKETNTFIGVDLIGELKTPEEEGKVVDKFLSKINSMNIDEYVKHYLKWCKLLEEDKQNKS